MRKAKAVKRKGGEKMSSKIVFKVDMLKDVKTVYKELKAEQKKKMGLVMRDLRRDVPAVVAKSVSKKFNLKTSEMKPPAVKISVNKSGQKFKSKKAVDVKVEGDSIESMWIEYCGRRLTVQRFGMNPKNPAKFTGRPGHRKRVKKEVKYSVYRGSQTKARMDGHRTFVTNVRGLNQAVYAKDGSRDIDVIAKTYSVPDMVDDKGVRKDIHKGINETVSKSLKRRYKD